MPDLFGYFFLVAVAYILVKAGWIEPPPGPFLPNLPREDPAYWRRVTRGSGHFLKGVLPDQRAAIEADKSLVLLTRPCSCIGYLAINDQKKPFDTSGCAAP